MDRKLHVIRNETETYKKDPYHLRWSSAGGEFCDTRMLVWNI
jgi:hypothetical protein